MVMNKEKVKLADVFPQTKDKLVKFKSDYNILHPLKEERLGTLGDTVDILIEIATVKVPELEKRIKELEKALTELEEKYRTTLQSIYKIDVDMKGENR